jgi:hypothetical protein
MERFEVERIFEKVKIPLARLGRIKKNLVNLLIILKLVLSEAEVS